MRQYFVSLLRGFMRLDYLSYLITVGLLSYLLSSSDLLVAISFSVVLLATPLVMGLKYAAFAEFMRRVISVVTGGSAPGPKAIKELRNSQSQAIGHTGSAHVVPSPGVSFASAVLYRILGNDLEPRHAAGQTLRNLRFILENEESFPGVEKRWVINRIADPTVEREVIEVLENAGQRFDRIPFVHEDYLKVGWDFSCLPEKDFLVSEAFFALDPEQKQRLLVAIHRYKNLYLMNNNGARNFALREGRKSAQWILPWDGNCFITRRAWESMRAEIESYPTCRVFTVPMMRVKDNNILLDPNLKPDAVEEPQLIFGQDFEEEFNENFPYGRRPKVEMLWRLGIPGPWDRWKDDPWDQKRRPFLESFAGYRIAGWVGRLESGRSELENSGVSGIRVRGQERERAILGTLTKYAQQENGPGLEAPNFWNPELLFRLKAHESRQEQPLIRTLRTEILDTANEALEQGPYSVTQKTTLAPSGNIRDYWHPAPYWWPDPTKKDGLPYIQKDSQRVPGTVLYSPESEKYDRTRLQMLFEATNALMLAWFITSEEKYLKKASELVDTWFVDPSTAMNPHLEYAQVRMGRNNNRGFGGGIIEFKDFYYFLDSLNLARGATPEFDLALEGLSAWLEEYRDWLTNSEQGVRERKAKNNHGTYYDLQMGAIELFLGHRDAFQWTYLRGLSRIEDQFDEKGLQVHELSRADTRHYFYFNLQGWLTFLVMAQGAGFVLRNQDTRLAERITKGIGFVEQETLRGWSFPHMADFDETRTTVLLEFGDVLELTPTGRILGANHREASVRRDVHSGIAPMWPAATRLNGDLADRGRPAALDFPQNSANGGPVRGKVSIIFLISAAPDVPFVDREARDKLLFRTLTSLRQSHSRDQGTEVHVIISGNDRPTYLDEFGSQVVFLEVPFSKPNNPRQGAQDKFRKRTFGAAWVRRNLPGEHYFMGLDQDDLVVDGLFTFIKDNSTWDHILLGKGYVFDAQTSELAVRPKGFWRGCGSSYIGRFSTDELPRDWQDRDSWFSKTLGGENSHSILDKVLTEASKDFVIPDEPFICQAINHGSNLTTLRGSDPKEISPAWVRADMATTSPGLLKLLGLYS